MEWLVELDERERFVRATEWDEFTLDEQAHFLSDIFTSPYWMPGRGVLIDYRDLKVTDLGEGDLMAISVIIQSLRRRIASSKIALLCEDDNLFELGLQFGMMVAPKIENSVVVFKDEIAAIDWLTAET